MSVTPPEELTYGKVVGRFLLSVADTTDDPDREPDAKAAEGLTVTLTPKTLVQRVEGASPVTVLRSSTTCTVGADGWLHDPAGAAGVWLVTGVYTVSYKATGLAGFSVPSQHTIEVTTAHDDDTPLDLTTAIPYVPPTGVTATTLEVVGSPVEGYVIGHVDGQTKWVEQTGGVTDHGALTGLSDDDHPQYHNDERGDARYYTKTQVDSKFIEANTYTDEKVGNLADAVVSSPQIGRIIAIEEGDDIPPLVDGDMLVTYAMAGTHYFTDFSEHTPDLPPSGWTVPWSTNGAWTVREDVDGTNGVVLRKSGSTGRRALIWEAISSDPHRRDVEILFKFRTDSTSGWIQGLARASGAGGAETGWRGGIQNASAWQIAGYVAGTQVSTVTGPDTFDADTWYLVRFRVNGDGSRQLKVWKYGDNEPTAWHTPSANSSITDPGWVGLFSPGSGTQDVDWVSVATGGRTAEFPT